MTSIRETYYSVRIADKKPKERGYKMAVFEITYFDIKDDMEHKHEIKYDGPEMSIADTWRMGLESAIKWCKENNVSLCGVSNICM